MKTWVREFIRRSFPVLMIPLLALVCAILIMVSPIRAQVLVFNVSGDFDGPGPFGGMGFEEGNFSGTFSYDMSAIDQYDDSQPYGDVFGRYALSAWSIDFFTSGGIFRGQMNSSHGGSSGTISLTPDPGSTGGLGNISLELEEPWCSFMPDLCADTLALFGIWFNSMSIITDDLPSDFPPDATFHGGLVGIWTGAEAPVTWVESASISSVLEPSIEGILLFFDQSVADGSLIGYGPGKSACGRLNALRNMFATARDFINNEDIGEACGQLEAALKKCDGKPSPPDFVMGPAASELYSMNLELLEELGCK